MSRSVPPLQAIHQKERELRQRVDAARQQAEAKIKAAHKEAEQIIAQADQQGRADAQALYDQGLERAAREAQALVKAAQEQALDIRRRAEDRLEDAALQIVALVLPRGSFSAR